MTPLDQARINGSTKNTSHLGGRWFSRLAPALGLALGYAPVTGQVSARPGVSVGDELPYVILRGPMWKRKMGIDGALAA